jgi:hypothetical protein
MKKVAWITGLLLLLASPATALDLESFLAGKSSAPPGSGLERIQNTIAANQDGPLDRFLSGTDDHPSVFPGGLDRFLAGDDGGQVSSPVQGIMDAFLEGGFEGEAPEDGEDGTNEGETPVEDELPFFSGGGTDLFVLPQESDDWDPFGSSDDEGGWFSGGSVWFGDSGTWGSSVTQ